jgi:hypothetical protein
MNIRINVSILLLCMSSAVCMAKTTTLLCETMAAAKVAPFTGAGSQYAARDANYSTWSVTIETNDEGKILHVTLDNDEKEFTINGDLLKFRAKLINSLEINIKTGRARTTVTGFDTREQGMCKVIAKTDKNLLE